MSDGHREKAAGLGADPEYIDLDRRFADVDNKEFDPESVLRLAEIWGIERSLSWDSLFQSERVIVLADAGSGKSWEMRHQVGRLRASGKAAFFVPLQMLAEEGLRDCLAYDYQEVALFDAWLSQGEDEAWLFLDAVDELKLTATTLDQALGRVARDIGPARARVRVVISCRPWDWRPSDLATVERRLPTSDPVMDKAPAPEDALLAPIRRQREKPPQDGKDAAPKQRVVVMLALNSKQIRRFLEGIGTPDANALQEEIMREEALPFARRPLDLKRLAQSWEVRRRLGSRLEQHEDDVQSALRDRTDRPDTAQLPPADAIEGIERLALAMALTKSRSLQEIDNLSVVGTGEGALSPTDILHDWMPGKVAALLRRAIFDPATLGRVQFHHRTIQEFLAARRLHKLRQTNLSTAELFRLLFADTYGERVLVPAMRPIAAWLAIWHPDIAQEILQREPEVLVMHGDPASLTLDVRREVLTAYVAAYGGGTWRGLSMPVTEMRRLAHPDLAGDIRTAWGLAPANEEVREFLLDLIQLGGLTSCEDIALDAAVDPQRGLGSRVRAIRGLRACKDSSALRAVADDMISHPDRWEDKLVIYSAPELFPGVVSVAELLQLIDRTPTQRSVTGDFSYQLADMAWELPAGSAELTELRDGLAALIMAKRTKGHDDYHPTSKAAKLGQPLASICVRQLDAGLSEPGLIQASLIAYRIQGESHHRDELPKLKAAIAARPDLKRALALQELGLAQELFPRRDAWDRYFHAFAHGSLSPTFVEEDWAWLLEEAEASKDEARGVFLVALAQLWWWRGQNAEERTRLITLAGSDSELAELVTKRTTPREPSDWETNYAKEEKKRKRNQIRQQKRDERSWVTWKSELEADLEGHFVGKAKFNTLHNLVRWLELQRNAAELAQDNWREARLPWGDAISDRFEAEMRTYWRDEHPPLRSDPATDRNVIYRSQNLALTGLSIEAGSGPGWAEKLSADEATLAAKWATLGLNQLPEWIVALAAAHPNPVRDVIAAEIDAELGQSGAPDHPHSLSSVQYGDPSIQKLIAPKAADLLRSWPHQPNSDEAKARWAQNIDRLLSILSRADAMTAEVAALCRERFVAAPRNPASMSYLRGVFAFDIEAGLTAMEQGLETLPADQRKSNAIALLANLFGDRRPSFPIKLTGQAADLVRLIRVAYRYVALDEDITHEGTFTPGLRDDAQSARNTLISALLDLPGKDAHRELLALADDPLLSHMPDRLRLLARERAAKDSELSALTASEYRGWEERQSWLPRTPAELFQSMMDRLDDIERDERHHPFNERHILAAITAETDMQPLLARRIESAARGAYQVSREEEVADKKEPDVRLIGLSGAGKAAVEIKIGDSWSVAELETALVDQLVGQYLRHEECSVGCLLITYGGRKGFEHPDTGKKMGFKEVIQHLRKRASQIQAADPRDIRIGIATLDLRSPLR